jgi:hypothetical protein
VASGFLFSMSRSREISIGELACIPFATAVAETCTHPIDFVKTRRQVSRRQVSSLEVATATFARGGVGGFFPALVPAVLRHWVYGTTRIGLYERMRSKDDGVQKKIAASFASGGLAQMLSSPFDLVKVKVQANAMHGNLNSTGVVHVLRDVWSREGVLGLYHGWKPNVLRACTSTMGELAAYDCGKQQLIGTFELDDNIYTHALSSVFSGFWATVCCNPSDVIKSRMMAAKDHATSTMTSVLRDTVRNDGWATLYKGFFQNWARFAPFQLIFWVTYEQARLLVGCSTFQ